jgi:hypothetical protein
MPNVENKNTKPISTATPSDIEIGVNKAPCEYLQRKIIAYAKNDGQGIEIDPEKNRKKILWFLKQNPDFPENNTQALNTMMFTSDVYQKNAIGCEWKTDHWRQIRVVKTANFIALLSGKLPLAKENTPIIGDMAHEIGSTVIYTGDVKNRDLYLRLNSIFPANW